MKWLAGAHCDLDAALGFVETRFRDYCGRHQCRASDIADRSDTLHVDDTPVPVLAPGTGKTKTGRLWTYVRDERPFASSRPPAALFFYSPDRKGEHPKAHLQNFRGVIHADGYSGFNGLFAGNRISEAACWAHPWTAP
jgi:transposase